MDEEQKQTSNKKIVSNTDNNNEQQAKDTDENLKSKIPIESLYEVPVSLSVLLGSTQMKLDDVLKLSKGVVIQLDQAVGEAVKIFVNNKMIGRGEIVVVEDKIGVTILELEKD